MDYAVYSYEIQEGERSLFYKDTKTKTIEKAHEIIGNLLHEGLPIIGKKNTQDIPLKSLERHEDEDIYTFVLCNQKKINQFEGHDKTPLESFPGSYVIFDNRKDVCQILVEKNGAFYSKNDQVIRFLKRTLDELLSEYGLSIIIKHKYQAGKFKELVERRIINNDNVKKIVWEYPNPDKIKGIDATYQTKKKLQYLSSLTQATKALKGKITLYGSKKEPMFIDEEKVDELAQMIALSAQNNYKLCYYFYNSPMINFKDVAYAVCSINSNTIHDFECKQLCNRGNGETYELIERLDEIRKEIADYDYEKIVDYRE